MMAKLNMLAAWSGINEFFGKRSAQSYFNSPKVAFAVSGACGSACGSCDGEDKPKKKPSACGSACGAGGGDSKPEKKPSACGSACGAGDKQTYKAKKMWCPRFSQKSINRGHYSIKNRMKYLMVANRRLR